LASGPCSASGRLYFPALKRPSGPVISLAGIDKVHFFTGDHGTNFADSPWEVMGKPHH
jgi:hypothetical protein